MSQPDNYTPHEVTGSTATIEAVLVWTFNGASELLVSQTDGVTTVTLADNDFDISVDGQTITVENFYGVGNTTTITLARSTKRTQEFTQLETNPLDSEGLNSTLNKIVRMIQDNGFSVEQIIEDIGGGEIGDLLLNAITSDDPYVETNIAGRANKFKAYDTNGAPIYVVPVGVEPPDGPVNPEDFLTIVNDIKVIAGTSYTYINADTGRFLLFTNTGNITATVPDDLVEGWQIVGLKRESGNVLTNATSGGAEIVNNNGANISVDNGLFYAGCYENAGSAAKVKFAGEIDSTSEGLNEELTSRVVTLDQSTNEANQVIIETTGKYLHENVKIEFKADLSTTTGGRALEFNGFGGPGTFTVEPLNAWAQDHTARPVQVTNTNTPLNTDYTQYSFDELYENFEVIKLNAAISLTANTCGKIQIQGISFSSKAWPIVLDSNSSYIQFLACHSNQVNSFTQAQLPGNACCLSLATNVGFITTLCTNDQDGDGFYFQGGTVTLDDTEGAGSHLVHIERGAVASETNGASNSAFTPSIAVANNDGGLFVSNGVVQ